MIVDMLICLMMINIINDSTFIKDEKVIDEILNISDDQMVKISEKYLSKLFNS